MRNLSPHGAAAVGAVASQLEGSGFKFSGLQGLFFMESDDAGKCLNHTG